MAAHDFASPEFEPCRVYEGEEAEARLRELQLSVDVLGQAIEAGDTARGQCGPFHPAQCRGHRLWGDTIASLRELTINSGFSWSPDSSDRLESTHNTDLDVAVTVMGGDQRTGQRGRAPRVRRRRGPVTRDRVVHNAFAGSVLFSLPGDRPDGAAPPELWILLLHCDEEAIRCELSRPVGFDEHGRVARWAERILLPSVPSAGGVDPIGIDDDDDDEPFGVTPRK